MWRGASCLICAIASASENEHGNLVAESSFSFIHLKKNQTHAGHSVVIFKRHVPELHELTEPELHGFARDIAGVGRVLTDVFEPVKIDSMIFGNLCPHLHCHVFPQYPHDDPHANPDINKGSKLLSDAEQAARVDVLREHLRAVIDCR